jgi:uncharacterized RDD family membrane protein YckC
LQNSDHPHYAGFGRRLAALLIDMAILFCVLLLVSLTIRFFRAVGLWEVSAPGAMPEEEWRDLGASAKSAVIIGFVVASGLLYFPLLESSAWQATVGKRLLGIHLAADDGSRISTGRAFGRWIAKWFAGWFGGALVSILTIASSDKRKAVHDWIARTVVLAGPPSPAAAIERWRLVVAIGLTFVWIMATMMLTL